MNSDFIRASTNVRDIGGGGIRSAIVGLGAGFGIGTTYADAKRDFETLSPPKKE